MRQWCPTIGLTLTTAVFAVVLASAPLHAGTIGPLAVSAPPVQAGPLVYTTQNWAGYAAETNFSSPQNNTVTAVSGSWIVPTANPSANPAANAN